MRWLIMGLLLAAVLITAPMGPAAEKRVVSLKNFIDCEAWQLDITWSAKDAFEDKDHIGQLEATATASYMLKRLDRQDAWGHWQALDVQSQNLSYRAFWQSKHSSARIDYASKAGHVVGAVADFQVGGMTPGWQLQCQGSFPAQIRDASMGTVDCPLGFGTSEMDKPGLSGVATGPLPESGTTIHGSRVILLDVPPFQTGLAGRTRVGIQFVLKPDPLAPLTPKKKR